MSDDPQSRADAADTLTVVCEPWETRFLAGFEHHPRGDRCRYCRRNIAMGRADPPGSGVCITCALDRGYLLEIDVPIGEPLPTARGARTATLSDGSFSQDGLAPGTPQKGPSNV